MHNTRAKTFLKVYICDFVCLSTKAIHTEVVSDLATQAFLNSFKRFVSRRGLVANIYSDNATNFVGAKNELNDIYRFLKTSNKKILKELLKLKIIWHFIPPRSPHMGGIWEASIKNVKYHLKRVVGSKILTLEELNTLVCQVESCVNSRPISSISDNPDDLLPLTPAHFLIEGPLHTLPDLDLTEQNIDKLSRFHMLTKMFQDFWSRWNKEYLHELQSRNKW